jgi:NO-binding membrane sensor protein with MHYT domain
MEREFKLVASTDGIILSVFFAFCGSYMTTFLSEQFRATENSAKFSSNYRLLLLLKISLMFGGVAIWTMHFLSMSSVTVQDEYRPDFQLYYNIYLTVISLIAVVVMSFIGFWCASGDPMFNKPKKEIVESFLQESKTLSMKEIRQLSKWKIIYIICTKSLGRIVLGGFIAGGGVCVMHYLGMYAISFDGELEWDYGIVAASVLIAITAATAALWILFRLLSVYTQFESLRLLSAVLMTVAVCGMHYTGMSACTAVISSSSNSHSSYSHLIAQEDAFKYTVISASVFFCIVSFILHVHSNIFAQEITARLAMADRIVSKLCQEGPGSGNRSVSKEVAAYKKKFTAGVGYNLYEDEENGSSMSSQTTNKPQSQISASASSLIASGKVVPLYLINKQTNDDCSVEELEENTMGRQQQHDNDNYTVPY